MIEGYLTPLRVENCDAKNWEIIEDFCWKGNKDVFTVYAGEFTDFASTPWWTQAILPRTGTWTKAAVLHDKMCNQQNEYYRAKQEWEAEWSLDGRMAKPIPPVFNSIDTDNIFRLNARNDGTDWIRSELLWFGVRCGAMSKPRREGWFKTFPRWFADLIVILAIIAAGVAALSWAWPW